VKIMVGANAGGGTDIIARMLPTNNQSRWPAFVVENKPGASNTIAADATAKRRPMATRSSCATNTVRRSRRTS
jgi:tripartite-type tricarboxylate transporter receptor subunit TctC